jgi:integrase
MINPAIAITHFAQVNKRDVLTVSQLPAFWAAIEQIENPSHRASFKLLLFTGLRRTDAATIKIEDIHEDHMWRGNPKGGPKRAFQLPLTNTLREIVAEALAARAVIAPHSPYLFPANGRHGHFCGQWHDQPNGVSPHAIRRTYASCARAAGLDLASVKDLLNHTHGGDVTLMSYIHVSLAQKLAAATTVAAFIDAACRCESTVYGFQKP